MFSAWENGPSNEDLTVFSSTRAYGLSHVAMGNFSEGAFCAQVEEENTKTHCLRRLRVFREGRCERMFGLIRQLDKLYTSICSSGRESGRAGRGQE